MEIIEIIWKLEFSFLSDDVLRNGMEFKTDMQIVCYFFVTSVVQ